MKKIVQAVEKYRALGYERVMPLTKQRAPMAKGWRERTEPWTDRQWAQAHGIGLPMGGGLIAIDVDTENRGVHEIVLRHCGDAPRKHGSRGLHIFGRPKKADQDTIVRKILTALDGEDQPRIEILSDGRYSVLPPSYHPRTDGHDTWVNVETLPAPDQLPILDVDAILANLTAAGHLKEWPKPQPVSEDAGFIPDLADVERCLARIDANDREKWVGIGFLLYRVYALTPHAERAFEVWDRWSATSPKYRVGECQAKWGDHDLGRQTGRQISFRSLIHWHREGGGQMRDVRPEFPFLNDKGSIKISSSANCAYALRFFDVAMRSNTFRGCPEIAWQGADWERLSDTHINLLWGACGARGWDFARTLVADTLHAMADEQSYDEAREHMEALPPWDGQHRLDTWLIEYCGAEDNAFVREAGAHWLRAIVRRQYRPGAKFDHVLVLQGEQGIGKSSAFLVLAGREDWVHGDFPIGMSSRELIEQTRGRLIIEWAELSGIHARDVEAVKSQVTTQYDIARAAYAREVQEIARRFVFAGTTNAQSYLRDVTGNRRFWVVPVHGKIDLAGLTRVRDQLMAEALHIERACDFRQNLSLQGEDAIRLSREAAEAARVKHPTEDAAAAIFADLPDGRVSLDDIVWKIGLGRGGGRAALTEADFRHIRHAAEQYGWVYDRRMQIDGKRQNGFRKGKSADVVQIRPDGGLHLVD